jgi:hypothetical protein
MAETELDLSGPIRLSTRLGGLLTSCRARRAMPCPVPALLSMRHLKRSRRFRIAFRAHARANTGA